MGFKPITIGQEFQKPEKKKQTSTRSTDNNVVQKLEDGSVILDFTKMKDVDLVVKSEAPDSATTQSRKNTKKKAIVPTPNFEENTSDRPLSIMESNEPIENKYNETNNILRSAILDIDKSLVDIQADIRDIRSSKTMRSKYTYLANLQAGVSSLIANKISAARELNSTIRNCNDFELKRYKEVQAINAASGDDDANVMKMYEAFMSTPLSSNALPNISNTAINSAALSGVNSINLGTPQDAGFSSYMQNLTPQQHMMQLEHDPNIKEVVVYNQENGSRYFDIIDMRTGQHVPNTEPMDAMFLEDVTIDLKNKIARNINLGESYPLVIVGQPIMNEY
nr:MAG TPA: hypothetical protein [Caudoviricetes sp.]